MVCPIFVTNKITRRHIAMKENENGKQERGVVHLFLKERGVHLYYGNLKALFDAQEKVENDGSLGVSYNYLKNKKDLFANGGFYSNDKVEIRKGIIDTRTKKEWVRNNKSRAISLNEIGKTKSKKSNKRLKINKV